MTTGEMIEHIKIVEKMNREQLLSEARKFTIDELRYCIVQTHAHRLQQAMLGVVGVRVVP